MSPSPASTTALRVEELLFTEASLPPQDRLVGLLVELCRVSHAAEVGWWPQNGTGLEALLVDSSGSVRRRSLSATVWSATRGDRTTVQRSVLVDGLRRGVLRVVPGERSPEEVPSLLERTAATVAVVLRSARLERDHAHWVGEEAAARADLALGRGRLVAVIAEERRRLAETLVGLTEPYAFELSETLRRAGAATTRQELLEALSEADSAAGNFLSGLRELAHGVHPLALREKGAAAAVVDLADHLGVPAVVLGSVRRAPWEVETGLFWALAAALPLVFRWPVDDAAVVRWSSDGGRLTCSIRVDYAGPVPVGGAQDIREGLVPQGQRLEALGGGWSSTCERRTVVASFWLPESLTRAAPNGP